MRTPASRTQSLNLELRTAALLALVGLFSMFVSPVLSVRADNLVDSLTTGSPNIPLVKGDTSGVVVNYWLVAIFPGCDVDATPTASVTFSVTVPSGITASPSALTFDRCGSATTNTQSVRYTADTSAAIGSNIGLVAWTLSSSVNGAGTAFNTLDSRASVSVTTPADSTNPTISITSPANNATYAQGELIAAMYSCLDNVAVASCTGTAANGAYIDTATTGTKPFIVNATDTANRTATTSVTYTVVEPDSDGDSVLDTSDNCPNDVNSGQEDGDNDGIGTVCDSNEDKPGISYTLDPVSPDGPNGWYTGDVTVDWTVTEGGSPIIAQDCNDVVIGTDGEHTASCSATNGAGESSDSVSFKRDATAPVITGYVGITDGVVHEYGSFDVLTWSCTATDETSGINPYEDENGDPIDCDLSGRATGLGIHTLSVKARDNAGNQVIEQTLTYTVVDTAAPVLSGVPGDITDIEATGPSGAVVSWDAPTAEDLLDGDVDVTCESASGLVSGDTFPLGSTEVTCTATDAAGNEASNTFDVVVVDTTKPVISGMPSDFTDVEATGPGGAVVSWDAPTALDIVDGDVEVTCLPTSGHLFEIGKSKVTCTATDAAGNEASASFDVTVVDTTAPVFQDYSNITVEADGPTGTIVNYPDPKTDDAVDGEQEVPCNPASGTLFPLGTTTVSCEDSDKAGNPAASLHFTVTVVDTRAPTIAFKSQLPAANAAGWNKSAVTVTWDCEDAVSGTFTTSQTVSSAGSGQSLIGTCTDEAGNSSSGNTVNGINIDLAKPTNIAFSSVVAGSTYYSGYNLPAVSCTASDLLSGLLPAPQGCVVTDPKAAQTPGLHTLTATATDRAGNQETAILTYMVDSLIIKGFYSPVTRDSDKVNSLKGGSTVPLKFEVFAGSKEITSTAGISLHAAKIGCDGSDLSDPVDYLASTSGNTGLRYDTKGGQFIYNWKSPTGSNVCYRVTLTVNGAAAPVQIDFKVTK